MKKFALTGLSFLLPAIAFAQRTDEQITSAQGLVFYIIKFINNVAVPLIFALSFLFFIIGVFQYFIMGASNAEKRKEGAQVIIYSIIGFFLMISIWGLVHILTGTIFVDNTPASYGKGLPQANPNLNIQ